VSVLPGAIRPMLLGFKTDEIKHTIRPSWPDNDSG